MFNFHPSALYSLLKPNQIALKTSVTISESDIDCKSTIGLLMMLAFTSPLFKNIPKVITL